MNTPIGNKEFSKSNQPENNNLLVDNINALQTSLNEVLINNTAQFSEDEKKISQEQVNTPNFKRLENSLSESNMDDEFDDFNPRLQNNTNDGYAQNNNTSNQNNSMFFEEKDSSTIKIAGLVHVISNILSGGLLGVITITILYILTKDTTTRNEKEAMYEIINFNLSFLMYAILSILLMIIVIGFLLLPIVGIIWFVLMIIGTIKHLRGEKYTYPMIVRFVN